MSLDVLVTWDFFWWFLLAALIVLGVYALIGLAREKRAAKTVQWRAGRPRLLDDRYICDVFGHEWHAHQTVWQCGECGQRIPRNAMTLEEEDLA